MKSTVQIASYLLKEEQCRNQNQCVYLPPFLSRLCRPCFFRCFMLDANESLGTWFDFGLSETPLKCLAGKLWAKIPRFDFYRRGANCFGGAAIAAMLDSLGLLLCHNPSQPRDPQRASLEPVLWQGLGDRPGRLNRRMLIKSKHKKSPVKTEL